MQGRVLVGPKWESFKAPFQSNLEAGVYPTASFPSGHAMRTDAPCAVVAAPAAWHACQAPHVQA